MSIYRDGEVGTAAARGPRFFQKDANDWYFHTREGFELGPYDSCLDAQEGLKDYLEFINRADPKTLEIFYAANAA
jgi:hypothetical protein